MTIRSKLLTSVAALTIASGAAYAEQHTAAETEANADATMSATTGQQTYAEGWNEDLDSAYGPIADRQIAELVGMNVVTEGGDDVGEVDNFVIMEEQLKAVVGVGGFLGLGEHHVALALEDLTYDGDRLVIPFTAEELEAMPEYTEELEQQRLAETDTLRTRGDMEATGEAETDMAATDTEAEGDALTEEDSTAMNMADGDIESDADEASAPSGEDVAAAEEAAGDEDTMTEEVAEAEKGEIEQEAEELAAEADAATEEAMAEGEEMAQDAEEATEEAGAELAEAGENAEAAVEEGAEEVAQETDEAMTEAEQMAENAEAETEQAIDEAAENLAEAGDEAEAEVESEMTAEADTEATTGESSDNWLAQFEEIADWTAADIQGREVATASGEVIGEIDELGMQDNRLVAVVGIGGFLGLGEHDVALDISEMSWDGEKFVADGYSAEELEGMAEYDPETVEPLEADATLRSSANM